MALRLPYKEEEKTMTIEQMNRELLNYKKYKGYTIKAYDMTDRFGFENIGLKDEDRLHLVIVAYSGRDELHRDEFMAEIRWIDENGRDRDLDPNLVKGLLNPDEKMRVVDEYTSESFCRRIEDREGRTFFHGCKWGSGRSIMEYVMNSYAESFVTYYGNLLQAAIKHRGSGKTAQDLARIAHLIAKVEKFGVCMNNPERKCSEIESYNNSINKLKQQISEIEEEHGRFVKLHRDSIEVLEKYGIPYERVKEANETMT